MSATTIAQITANGLNEYAGYMARGEQVPRHMPSTPGYWFRGLALASAEAWHEGNTELRALLSDEAKACYCNDYLDSDCYACAFDCHDRCSYGCLHVEGEAA